MSPKLVRFCTLRMTYLEGTLELMTTSPEHERFKKIIARLIKAFARDLDARLMLMTGQRAKVDRHHPKDSPYEWRHQQAQVLCRLGEQEV